MAWPASPAAHGTPAIPLETLAGKLAARGPQRAGPAPRAQAGRGTELPPPQGPGISMDDGHVIDRLRELVAMDTSYERSNEEIIAYLQDALRAHGFRFEVKTYRSEHDSCPKSLLIATRGQPQDVSLGLVVHTDGVPAGDWPEAFDLSLTEDGRLVGRGTASNKGALAVLLDLVAQTADPMQLFFSFNQEGGLTGVEHLIEEEPDFDWPEHMLVYGSTGLVPVSAAKGYGAYHAHFAETRGLLDFLCRLDDIQRLLQLDAYCDARFDPPYGTLNAVFPDGPFGFTQVPTQASLTVCHAQTPDGEAARTIMRAAIDASNAESGAVQIGYRALHDGYEITFSAPGGHGSIGGAHSAVGGMTRYWSHLKAGLDQAGLPADAVVPHFQANKPELLIEYRPLPFDTANALDLQLMIEKAMHACGDASLGDNALIHLGHSEGFNTAPDDPLLVALENIAQSRAKATSRGSEAAPLAAKRPSTAVIGHGLPEQRLHATGEYTTIEELRQYFALLAHTVNRFAGPSGAAATTEAPRRIETAARSASTPVPAPSLVLVAGEDALPEARRLYGSAPMLVLLAFDPLSITNIVEQLFVQSDNRIRFDRPIPIVGSQDGDALRKWTAALHEEVAYMSPHAGPVTPSEVFPPLAVDPQANRYRHTPTRVEIKAGAEMPAAWLHSPAAGTTRYFLPVMADADRSVLVRALRQSRVHFVFQQTEWLAYLIAKSRNGGQRSSWEVLTEEQPLYEATCDLLQQLRNDSPSTPLSFGLIGKSGGEPLPVAAWAAAEEGNGREFVHPDGSVARIEQDAAGTRIRIDLRSGELAQACLALDALCDVLERRNIVARHIDVVTSAQSEFLAGDFAQVLALHGIAGELDSLVELPDGAAGPRRALSLSVQAVRDYYGDGMALSAADWRPPTWEWEPGLREPCFWQCEDAWSFADRTGGGIEMVVADRNRGAPQWAVETIGATAQLAAHVYRAGISAERLRIVTVSGEPQVPSLSALSTLLNTIASPSARHEVRLEHMAIGPTPDGHERSLFTPYLVGTPPTLEHQRLTLGRRDPPELGCIILPTAYLRDSLATVVRFAQEQGRPLLIMASKGATPSALAAYFREHGLRSDQVHVVYVDEGYRIPGLPLATSAIPIPGWDSDVPEKRRLGQLIAQLCGWRQEGTAILMLDDDVIGMTNRDLRRAQSVLTAPQANIAGFHFQEPNGSLPDHSFIMLLARIFAHKLPFIGEGALLLRDFLLFLDMFSEGWLPLIARRDAVDVGPMHQKQTALHYAMHETPEQAAQHYGATQGLTFSDILAESFGQWVDLVPREWLTDPLMWKIAIAQRRGLLDYLETRLDEPNDVTLLLYLVSLDARINDVPPSQIRETARRKLAEERAMLDPESWPRLMADFMRAVFDDFESVPRWVEEFAEQGGDPEERLGIRFSTEGGFTRPAYPPTQAA
jgi:acetylornithine deacetylase/succinyl-diaminopimelate desuccinylase-like protein